MHILTTLFEETFANLTFFAIYSLQFLNFVSTKILELYFKAECIENLETVLRYFKKSLHLQNFISRKLYRSSLLKCLFRPIFEANSYLNEPIMQNLDISKTCTSLSVLILKVDIKVSKNILFFNFFLRIGLFQKKKLYSSF